MWPLKSDRLLALYASRPKTIALAAGVLSLAVIYVFHQLIGFTPAFRSLYILPLWISTRLGGRSIGFVLVVLTTFLDGLVEVWLAHQTSMGEVVSDGLIRFGSLGAIMLLFAQLEESLTRYQVHARHDPLTGLLNRRALHEFAHSAMARAQRRRYPFTVAVIDCDGFKELNDTHGHEAGDRALQLLAQVLEGNIRSSDFVARTGGDEFVLILQDSVLREVEAVLDRVQKAFVEAVRRHGWQSSLSVGYAVLKPSHKQLDELIREADDQMYRQKSRKKQASLYFS